jgi:hypothetical protein
MRNAIKGGIGPFDYPPEFQRVRAMIPHIEPFARLVHGNPILSVAIAIRLERPFAGGANIIGLSRSVIGESRSPANPSEPVGHR